MEELETKVERFKNHMLRELKANSHKGSIHSHNLVDDAKRNAEALLEMQKRGLNIKLK